MSAPEFDVAVVGAGPAGSFAALHLARAGHRVALLERAHFPRPKVCGACLHPAGLAELGRAGLLDRFWAAGARPLDRARIHARREAFSTALSPAGAVLSREAFDSLLAESAREAGADLRYGAAARLLPRQPGASGRRLAVGDTELRARFVLAADGLGGQLLARAGELELSPKPPVRVGLGARLPAGSWDWPAGEVGLWVGDLGYAGLVRLEDGDLDLAAAVDPLALSRSGPEALVAQILREAAPSVAAAPRAPWDLSAGVDLGAARWRGTPALARRRGPAAAIGVLALGDAAGYVEPFSGEGMSWALRGARVAAQLVDAALRGPQALGGGLERAWERARARHLEPRQRVCAGLGWLCRHPRLLGRLLFVATRSPAVGRFAVGPLFGARAGVLR